MSCVATSSLWPAAAVPSAAILGAFVTVILARVNEATNRRRDRYAEAVQTLVAWTEYPYRVRRRTDDSPATLTALANQGHDLQERLALHQAWIATEHPALAQTYAAARSTLDRIVGPLISEAWEHCPVTKASAMNLRGWGPNDECREAIAEVQREIQSRFGIRRPAKWLRRQIETCLETIRYPPRNLDSDGRPRHRRRAPRRLREASSPVDVGRHGSDEGLDKLRVKEGGDQLDVAAGGPDERAER